MTCLFPGEARFLGLTAKTVRKLLPKFGVSGRMRKTAAQMLVEAAERGPCGLWHKLDGLGHH